MRTQSALDVHVYNTCSTSTFLWFIVNVVLANVVLTSAGSLNPDIIIMYALVYQKVMHPNGANTQSQLLDQFHTAPINTDSCNNSQKMITDITLSECEGCGSCPSAI